MIDNVYTTYTHVAYDMNTKKHGTGHTQHREGDFKFVYVRSLTLNHSSAILSDVRGGGGGALLLKKKYLF